MANRMMRCQNACMVSSDFPKDRTTVNTGNMVPMRPATNAASLSGDPSIVLLQASDVDRYRAGSRMKIWL